MAYTCGAIGSFIKSRRLGVVTYYGYGWEGWGGPPWIVLSAFLGSPKPAFAAFFFFFLSLSSSDEDESAAESDEDSSSALFFLGYDLYSVFEVVVAVVLLPFGCV